MENKTKLEDVICDVVVVGAGLVGLAAVIALAIQGKRVVLIDANVNQNFTQQKKIWDTRVYALTPSTEKWLCSLGVWSAVDQDRVNNIDEMLLWNDQSEQPLCLQAEDAMLTKLACIVENQNLMHALWKKIDMLDVRVLADSTCQGIQYNENAIELSVGNNRKVSAALLVAADGANSFVRKQLSMTTKVKPFDQTALVANYATEQVHGDIARQWFAPHETLALLPLPGKQVSMVWSVPTKLATELLSLSELVLAERVQTQSNGVLGVLKPITATFSFKLGQVTANKFVTERVVLIGDAAHQVHPMAGQGVNLGFRDVIALAQLIANSHYLQDIGEAVFLRQYERNRKADVIGMNTLTSGLDSWFSRESEAVKKMTAWGMSQLNKQSSIKSILIKHAIA